jgi:predicted Zn-dependent peptidase
MSVIKNVTPDTVRNFYSTHYHPQLMAVIAVGHFQQPLSEVVATLQRIFEASPKRIDDAQLPHRPPILVPKEQHPIISVFVDKVRRNVTLLPLLHDVLFRVVMTDVKCYMLN